MTTRGLSFTGWALAISGTLGALLLGLILHLQSRAEDQRERLETSKKDFELAKQMRTRYRELETRLSKMPPEGDKAPQSWQVFLAQQASAAGLPTPVIVPELQVKVGTMKEHPFTVSLDAGAGGTVNRRAFVRFLDLVESQRPGFKSKSISFKFAAASPEEFSRATATFSHFER